MKKTKNLGLIIAFFMVLQLIVPINFTLAGSVPTGSNVTEDIIWLNNSRIEITDSIGNEILPVNGVYEEIPKDAKIRIRYDFGLPDGDGYNFEAGDYFIVNFPEEINFQNIDDELFETGGVKGTLNLENNRAMIIFTELAASNVTGYFEVEGQFVENEISEGETVSINLGYSGGIINIGFKETPPPDVDIDIEKTGSYDDSTNIITWSVKITPEEGKTAKKVSVTDTFSGNQVYVDNSITVYKNSIDITSPSAITVAGNKITYKFPEGIEGEHVITYQTTPKSNAFSGETGTGKVTFTNNAAVKLDQEEKGQANAKIELDWIQKKGNKDNTDGKIIHWEITVNNDANSIDNAVLTDTIPDGLELISGTVTVKNGEGSEESVSEGTAKGEYSYVGKTLTYRYDGNLNTKSVVKYDTVITDDIAYNQNNQIKYKNNAKLTWENNIYGTPSAEGSVSIGVGSGIIDKYGVNKFNFNDSHNEILWTIKVNKNKTKITNPVLVDSIPLGLEYIDGSFTISPPNSVGEFNYVGNITTTGSGIITYEFNKEINESYTITFKTKITDYSKLFINGVATFSNSASLSGDELVNKKQTDSSEQKVDSQVIQKTVLNNYDYTNRRTKWQIIVNRNKMELTNAVLTDIIPEGMEFLPDTFEIDANIDADEGRGLTYDDNSFTYKFPETITDEYTITFETIVNEAYLSQQENLNKDLNFTNKSVLNSQDFSNNVSSEASETVKNYIIGKQGSYVTGADYIKWAVPINSNQVKLSDIEVSDTLQNGLELDVDSVKLYNAEVAASDGSLIKGSIVDKSEYIVLYENKVFTFKISGETDKAYQLEFVTDVLADRLTVKNTIEFKGAGKIASETADDIVVRVSELGTGISGETGSVTITKVDEEDENKLLSGAQFRIYRLFNGVEKYSETLSTDINGQIVFDELLYKTHYIEEINAPDGYILNPNVPRFRITSDYRNIQYTFTNKKALGDIKLIKQTENGEPLQGAEFTLYKDNLEIQTETSDAETGEVVFENIEVGTYTIKETKAQKGYVKYEGVMNVEIKVNDNQNGVDVIFTDEEKTYSENEVYILKNSLVPVFADVVIEKTDDSDTLLEGAEFGLYDINDDNKLIKTVLSNSEDKVTFTDVALGDYTIKEIKSPDGYYKSDDTITVKVTRSEDLVSAEVELFLNEDENPTNPIKVINKPVNIELKKVDENNIGLSGAEFTLFNSSEESVQTVMSDNNGAVRFEKVGVGNYTIKETKAPSGFYLSNEVLNAEVKIDDENNIEVTLKKDGEIIEDGYIIENESIPNRPSFGKIVINKADDNNNSLAGAVFTLYNDKGKVIQTGTTDANGKIEFNHVAQGSYVIKETKAPEGYVLSEKETNVTISGTATKTFNFTNKKEVIAPILGKVEIIKTDDEGKLLQGAKFNLYDANNVIVQSLITGPNGKALFENLPLGNYTIEEIVAPTGYELSKEKINVTVDKTDLVEVIVKNKKTETTDSIKENNLTGNILINKVDENQLPLEGAQFTLYDKDGFEIRQVISDINGTVLFDNLQPGKYSVKETKAPEGYELVSDTMYIDVKDAKTYSYNFVNIPLEEIDDPDVPRGWEPIDDPEIPKSPGELPDTGSIFGTFMLIIIGSVLILLGVALIFKRRFIG